MTLYSENYLMCKKGVYGVRKQSSCAVVSSFLNEEILNRFCVCNV